MYKLYYIWLVPAVFCLVYYVCCVAYAGFASSFITIWPVTAVFFAGMILCGLYVGISHVIEKAKKEAYLSAQKNEMKAVTQETYADGGLR